MFESDVYERFNQVFLPHLADAQRLARWLTGNRADAEDVAQEAALRAFRSIAQFSGGNARAWCLTIVRNAAYSLLSKKGAEQALTSEDAALENMPLADGATPETLLMQKIEAAQLDAAFAALPMPFREIVVLRDLQGLNYREIAAVTETPIGTVMSRLARGRHMLMQKLTEMRE